MATFISDTRISHLQTYPTALEYVTLTGTASRSGNTVTLSNLIVSVRVSVVYSCYGETQNYYIANTASGGALTQTGTFELNFNDGPNHTESHSLPNVSITVGASDTSKILYLRATSNEDAQIPFTITFPTGVVAPNTPTISGTTSTYNINSITYGTSSFGTPSTGTVYLYRGTSASPTTQITSKTTTGSSTYSDSGLIPNTTYYYRARAYNGSAYSDYSNDSSVTTLAPTPTASVVSKTGASVTFAWEVSAHGGAKNLSLKYRVLQGSTVIRDWYTLNSLISTSGESGTQTVNGLSENVDYTIELCVYNSTGTIQLGAVGTLNVTTTELAKMYCSANNVSELVGKMYCSGKYISSLSATITTQYNVSAVNVNLIKNFLNDTSKSYRRAPSVSDNGGELTTIKIISGAYSASGITYTLVCIYASGNNRTFSNLIYSRLGAFGFTVPSTVAQTRPNVTDIISISPTYIQGRRKVQKFYGSVNGKAKLLFELT